MTSRDFCFWLQGYFEINQIDQQSLSHTQVNLIKDHLALVFKHEIDLSMGDNKHQEELNEIHNSGHSDYNLPDNKKVVMRC